MSFPYDVKTKPPVSTVEERVFFGEQIPYATVADTQETMTPEACHEDVVIAPHSPTAAAQYFTVPDQYVQDTHVPIVGTSNLEHPPTYHESQPSTATSLTAPLLQSPLSPSTTHYSTIPIPPPDRSGTLGNESRVKKYLKSKDLYIVILLAILTGIVSWYWPIAGIIIGSLMALVLVNIVLGIVFGSISRRRRMLVLYLALLAALAFSISWASRHCHHHKPPVEVGDIEIVQKEESTAEMKAKFSLVVKASDENDLNAADVISSQSGSTFDAAVFRKKEYKDAENVAVIARLELPPGYPRIREMNLFAMNGTTLLSMLGPQAQNGIPPLLKGLSMTEIGELSIAQDNGLVKLKDVRVKEATITGTKTDVVGSALVHKELGVTTMTGNVDLELSHETIKEKMEASIISTNGSVRVGMISYHGYFSVTGKEVSVQGDPANIHYDQASVTMLSGWMTPGGRKPVYGSNNFGQANTAKGNGLGEGQQPVTPYQPDRKGHYPSGAHANNDNITEQETFGSQQPYAQPALPPYAPPQYDTVVPTAPVSHYQNDVPWPSESENAPFLRPQQPYAPYHPEQQQQQPRGGQQSPYHPEHPYSQQPYFHQQYPNYGAIPAADTSAGPSYPVNHPVGQRIEDHHNDLQNKILMCLPGKFILFPDYVERCSGDHTPLETFAHNFAPAGDSSLKVHIKSSITTIVKVVEASTASQNFINIKYDIYASDPQLARTIRKRVEQHSSGSHQSSILNGEDIKFPRNCCANVDVEISYPQQMFKSKKLEIDLTNGNIHYNVSEAYLTLDDLVLSSTNGGIFVDAAVERRASFGLLNGSLRGNLMAGGSVRAKAVNGAIDLVIASHTPENLDVKLETVNGRVKAALKQTFEGHFELAAVNGRVQFLLPSSPNEEGSVDMEEYNGRGQMWPRPPPVDDPSGYHVEWKEQRSNVKSGWASKSGVEPAGELPRVHLNAISGAITLRLEE
ncbi:hypothetical protein BGW42_004314 [Actinomortierella wolfii]|nr:hypothetical protein BGW42_004314 [Actinomortierella wolfii]